MVCEKNKKFFNSSNLFKKPSKLKLCNDTPELKRLKLLNNLKKPPIKHSDQKKCVLLNIILAKNIFLNLRFLRPERRSQKKNPLLSSLTNRLVFFQKIAFKNSFFKKNFLTSFTMMGE